MFIKKLVFISALLAVTTSSWATIIPIEHWTTSNGGEVYFVPLSQLPMIDIEVAFNAGSARDGSKSGLAQLTNALISEGTTEHNADQIAEIFDDLGVQFGNGATRDMSIFKLRSLSDPTISTPAINLFAETLTKANFPNEAFMRNQLNMLNIIAQQEQSPDEVANQAFMSALYGKHPYAHAVNGTKTSVTALTIADLKDFYQRYFVAKNATVAIVGNITTATAHQIADKILLPIPAGEAAPILAAAPVAAPVINHINFPIVQTQVLLGQIGIKRGDPLTYPLAVGNFIIGGGDFVSKLFNIVRAQNGLVYGISSNFAPLAAAGPFYIGFKSNATSAKAALNLTKKVFADFMKNPVAVADINTAKKNIIGSFPLQFASNSAILDKVMNIAFYHLPLSYYDTYCAKINAVTADDIHKAFAKIFAQGNLNIISVGQRNPND